MSIKAATAAARQGHQGRNIHGLIWSEEVSEFSFSLLVVRCCTTPRPCLLPQPPSSDDDDDVRFPFCCVSALMNQSDRQSCDESAPPSFPLAVVVSRNGHTFGSISNSRLALHAQGFTVSTKKRNSRRQPKKRNKRPLSLSVSLPPLHALQSPGRRIHRQTGRRRRDVSGFTPVPIMLTNIDWRAPIGSTDTVSRGV